MEVVKKGINKRYEKTCNRCQSDLVYSLADTYIKHDYCPNMEGNGFMDFGLNKYTRCPVCGNEIYICEMR